MATRLDVEFHSHGEACAAGLMTAPDCLAGYTSLVPPGSRLRNEVTARSALQIMAYRPGTLARQIACPAFFAICSADSVAPSRTALRQVPEAPCAETKVYAAGHFDIYVGALFEQAVADQIALLKRHVPTLTPVATRPPEMTVRAKTDACDYVI